MKKKVFFLLIFILSFIHIGNAQAYIKFASPPKMTLKPAQQFRNYNISYNTHTKSTIYLELKKGNTLVGNGVYDITKPGEKTVFLNLNVFKNVKFLKVGNDYSYHLYMYEGGRNDWSKKACKTIVIKNVSVEDKKNRLTSK